MIIPVNHHVNMCSDYKSDPYSQGDPCNSICCRNDLREHGASPGGCYDTKVSWLPVINQSEWVLCSPDALVFSVRWRICTWLRSSWLRRWTARPQTEGFLSSPGRCSTARPIRVFLWDTTSASSWCSRSSSAPEDHGISHLACFWTDSLFDICAKTWTLESWKSEPLNLSNHCLFWAIKSALNSTAAIWQSVQDCLRLFWLIDRVIRML